MLSTLRWQHRWQHRNVQQHIKAIHYGGTSAVENDVPTDLTFSMPNFTPCSESSRTQKFIYRMTFELWKLAQEFGRSQWGPIPPPPPTECVTSQIPMGRGLKHHCIPILPLVLG